MLWLIEIAVPEQLVFLEQSGQISRPYPSLPWFRRHTLQTKAKRPINQDSSPVCCYQTMKGFFFAITLTYPGNGNIPWR